MRMITINKSNMSPKKLVSAFKSNPVSLAVIPAIVIALSFGLNYAYATWTEPTGIPPSNNTDTPLNVGSSAQKKTGPLYLDSVFTGDISGSLGAANLSAAFGPHDISGGPTQLLIVGNIPGNAVLNLQPYTSTGTGGTLTIQGVSKLGGVGDATLAVDGNIMTTSNIGNNAYVRTYDVYLTSIGKWASTLGGGGVDTTQSSCTTILRSGIPSPSTCTNCTCSPGYYSVGSYAIPQGGGTYEVGNRCCKF